MHPFFIHVIFNHSILIAAVIGMFRFKYIISDFYPFLIFIWLGLFNDSLSLALIMTHRSNAANSNIFVFVELAVVLWMFFTWNKEKLKVYICLAIIATGVWLADNFFINSISENNSLFRVFYSFLILFISIDNLNKLLFFENGRLTRNPKFIICLTFLFYYGFNAFIESFNIFHLGLSSNVLNTLWWMLSFVNLIANLLYALAVLWVPTKVKFILRY